MVAFAELDIAARTDQLVRAKNELQALVGAAGRAEAASEKFTASTNKSETALSSMQKQIAASTGMLDGMGKNARESAGAFEELARMASGIDQLRSSIDPVYASSVRYAQALEQLDAALSSGVVTQQQYNTMLAQAERAYLGVANGATAMHGFGNSMMTAGSHTANLTFQLQDIAMMLAAGQNPLMLAMQQGTQVSGIFMQMGASASTVGPMIGAAFKSLISPMSLLTIGVIAGGAALGQWAISAIGAADSAQTFSDALDQAETSMRELRDVTDLYSSEGLETLIEKYGEVNSAVLALLDAQRLLAQNNALNDVNAALEAITAGLGEGLFATQVGEIAEAFETTSDRARGLLDVMENIANLPTQERQLAVIQNLTAELSAATNGFTEMNSAQFRMLGILTEAEDKVRQFMAASKAAEQAVMPLPSILDSARSAADRAAGAVAGIGSAAEGAVGAVSNLAAKMWDMAQARIAANNALETLAFENSPAGQALGQYGGRGTSSDRPIMMGDGTTLSTDTGVGSGAGTGGVGGASAVPFEERLNNMMGALEQERAVLDEWYEESQSILADRRAMEILGEEEHRLALIGVEEEYQARMAEIRAQASQAEISMRQQTVDMAIGLLQQLGQRSKALAAIAVLVNAAQRIAEIRANTAAAVMRAYAELGPIAGSAAAAKIKAMGAVQTGIAMASAALQLGGGGAGGGSASIGSVSGGASTGGGSRAPTAAPEQAQNRFLRIEVNGEGMFAEALRDNVQSIADAITDLGGRGGTTILVGR